MPRRGGRGTAKCSVLLSNSSEGRCPFPDSHIDTFTYVAKLSHYIQIAEPKDICSLRSQVSRPSFIISHFFRGAMLGTIQFYHKLCFVAIEIHNVISDHVLAAKPKRITAQELIPQMRFLFRHIPAKILCSLDHVLILFHKTICFLRRKISPFLFSQLR